MCRILVLAGKPRINTRYIDFINAFIRSSEYDHYLTMISRARKSHGDGWGLAGIGLIHDEPTILFHKDILPIYHSLSRDIINLFINRIKRYDEIYLILHARLSSIKEPYGMIYAHPYEARIGEKGFLWFIHNGGIDKIRIYREAGVETPYYYTDSWIASLYIARNLSRCIEKTVDIDNCIVEVYEKLVENVLSALNTGLLVYLENKPFLYASFYYKNFDELDSRKKDYYQLKTYSSKTLNLVVSSSIDYYIKHVKNIQQGIYKILPDKIIKIVNFT